MSPKARSNRTVVDNVRRVKQSGFLAAAAATTLAIGAGGVLVAAPASAYPPGTHMSVHAHPIGQPNRHRDQLIQVRVRDGKPGCDVQINGGGDNVLSILDANGRTTVVLDAKIGRLNQITIRARTKRCHGAQETAVTVVHISPGQAHGRDHTNVGRPYRVEADNWRPRRPISFIATDGRHTVHQDGHTDADGHAAFTFTPSHRGEWAIILIQDGLSANYTVDVR
jgi:hypothetical protein